MKKFRKLIKEFRGSIDSSNNFNDHDDDDDDEFSDIRNTIRNIPFTYKTKDNHEIHFKNSEEALSLMYKSYDKLDDAHDYAEDQNDNDMMDHIYKSLGHHLHMIESIHAHIMSHKKFANTPKQNINYALSRIYKKTLDTNQDDHLKKIHYTNIKDKKNTGNFSHYDDIIETVKQNPDMGYVLKQGEI